MYLNQFPGEARGEGVGGELRAVLRLLVLGQRALIPEVHRAQQALEREEAFSQEVMEKRGLAWHS